MRVCVPASSANLGPGFDTLGLALRMPFHAATEPDESLLRADERHPLVVAYRRSGGTGSLWWRSPIPPGRGLGFSGAARVAGAVLGTLEALGSDHITDEVRSKALAVAVDLEGHPDNAAASMLGGVVASVGSTSVKVPLPVPLEVVVWWPRTETSTRKARAALPDVVPFEDAVFNVAHSSVLVAALASGDLKAIGLAMQDRLHQERRLDMSPRSRVALDAMRRAGVVGAWLGGSGPTVACFVTPGDGKRVTERLPGDGTSRVLRIDMLGARIVAGDGDTTRNS